MMASGIATPTNIRESIRVASEYGANCDYVEIPLGGSNEGPYFAQEERCSYHKAKQDGAKWKHIFCFIFPWHMQYLNSPLIRAIQCDPNLSENEKAKKRQELMAEASLRKQGRRHLCLCRVCEIVVDTCPLCYAMKNANVEVYMSCLSFPRGTNLQCKEAKRACISAFFVA
eukprot:Gb_17069 [translate_table: standard]